MSDKKIHAENEESISVSGKTSPNELSQIIVRTKSQGCAFHWLWILHRPTELECSFSTGEKSRPEQTNLWETYVFQTNMLPLKSLIIFWRSFEILVLNRRKQRDLAFFGKVGWRRQIRPGANKSLRKHMFSNHRCYSLTILKFSVDHF